jgi:hypothetical protein
MWAEAVDIQAKQARINQEEAFTTGMPDAPDIRGGPNPRGAYQDGGGPAHTGIEVPDAQLRSAAVKSID